MMKGVDDADDKHDDVEKMMVVTALKIRGTHVTHKMRMSSRLMQLIFVLIGGVLILMTSVIQHRYKKYRCFSITITKIIVISIGSIWKAPQTLNPESLKCLNPMQPHRKQSPQTPKFKNQLPLLDRKHASQQQPGGHWSGRQERIEGDAWRLANNESQYGRDDPDERISGAGIA